GSTPYFARFGDEAGRKLQQRHYDFVQRATAATGGRVVDTAGDGVFLAFPTADAAARSFIDLHARISEDNLSRSRDQQLQVRIGFHYGSVLTDGEQVTGDAVNLASRVAGTADPGEIRLTRDAFRELSNAAYRISCRSLGPTPVKGVQHPVDLLSLVWRDGTVFPDVIRIHETAQDIPLPSQDVITFGRLADADGAIGNDVVLALGTDEQTRKISRWQFELRRYPDGFRLRPVSDQITEVDGQVIARGAEAAIRPGSRVRVARAATLEFISRTGVPLAAGETAAVD
ncbi:MAG TPA: adenylate/guanylate cyclase domain-containing protein, partial [Polyangia bacterium]|nr:adenylate/guanylate cyclase domain-containing protein [Polyangia bacterium]